MAEDGVVDTESGAARSGRDHRLLDMAHALTADVADRVRDPRAPGLTLFGAGDASIVARLALLERETARSLRNLQRNWVFDPFDEVGPRLDRRARVRGVALNLLVPPRVGDRCPLFPDGLPHARFAPVDIAALLIDDVTLLCEGPRTLRGYPTAWLTSDRMLVRQFIELWDETHARSAALPVTHDLLTGRELAMMRAVCRGEPTGRIATQNQVSPRTVERVVRELQDRLAVGSRPELVCRLLSGSRPQSP